MSLNTWIGLLIVLVPAVLLACIAGAARICERTARDGTDKARTLDKAHFPRQSSA
jgi:hypothetical protein